MRCITAICPAGPPKLCKPTRTQTRTASANVTGMSAGCTRHLLSASERSMQLTEELLARGQPLLVGPVHATQAVDDRSHAGRLAALELPVLEVDVVHDLSDDAERRVVDAEARDQ